MDEMKYELLCSLVVQEDSKNGGLLGCGGDLVICIVGLRRLELGSDRSCMTMTYFFNLC